MWTMDSVQVKKLGTAPETVMVRGLACRVQNNSTTATVYIRERREDGADADTDNGWAIAPGGAMSVPLVAMELSMVATAANTDVRVLVLDEE